MDTDALVQQLAAGFEVLQEEYQKLHGQHEALERKLATARDQYNEIAKLYGTGQAATPPLSLSFSPGRQEPMICKSAAELLASSNDHQSTLASTKVEAAFTASQVLRSRSFDPVQTTADGVKIWSGPSADRTERAGSMMPSISESPLEQDFTVEGVPSKLGCPFASMAGKKLSLHAASVLSRYNTNGSAAAAPSTPLSSVSHINGRDSMSRRSSRRASFADPIKAEICGLSDHKADGHQTGAQHDIEHVVQDNAEPGVCPIRFLNQHSPEEVATYFEKHKHELPRSHETCVRRYQSNEQQIRELDEKYGNLVSMIQGLGVKHQPMLPKDPQDDASEQDAESAEKVRNWASSVIAQAPTSADPPDEERQQHFERPLRDIRVGESPSRPWGIHVPEYQENEDKDERSTQPAEVTSPPLVLPTPEQSPLPPAATHHRDQARKAATKCPFGFDQVPKKQVQQQDTSALDAPRDGETPHAAFIAPNTEPNAAVSAQGEKQASMVFTGPVFIGYSAEDAIKILRESGLGAKQ